MSRRQRLRPVFGGRSLNVPAWVISGIGLVLAGLSLWYLIVVRAFVLTGASRHPTATMLLEVLEIALLGGFSFVLVYAGYWLASSQFDERRLWWAGLWTLIGMTGIVALVALVNSLQIAQGERLSEPTFIQMILLAAGGGAIAGLLIGISTLNETVEAERAKQQRDTLVFINELLRHNVLNGMQVIKGNAQLLEGHVNDEGKRYLETTQDRSDTIVDLIQNVRVLVDSLSRESSLRPIDLERTCAAAVSAARSAYPHAEFELDVPADAEILADELVGSVFENVLANAIEHNDTDTPSVTMSGECTRNHVVVRLADNGPGIPAERRERCFDPGEQDESSVGQGLGLYLVRTLMTRYDGDVWVESNDPRGTVIVLEFQRADR